MVNMGGVETHATTGIKQGAAYYKADQSDPKSFTAIVSVFNNVDHQGDIVRPGAFEATLAEFEASGKRIPVVWSHDSRSPDSYIGEVVAAKELAPGDPELPAKIRDLGGLWIKAALDDDGTGDTKRARQVHRQLKGKRINEFSFAYTVDRWAAATIDGKEVYELLELSLIEVGPCLRGANPATQLVDVKAVETPLPSTAHTVSGGQDPRATLTMMKLYQASLRIKGTHNGSSSTH